jgi:hypothetical protein
LTLTVSAERRPCSRPDAPGASIARPGGTCGTPPYVLRMQPSYVDPGIARFFDLPILDSNNPKACREARMNIHLHNADIVMIIALALLGALLLALRFRPASWKGIVLEALAANAAAIAAVVAFEMLVA